LTKFQILTGREIWGVIRDPIGAPKSPPKFGINGPMIPLKKLKFSVDKISNFDGAWNLRGDLGPYWGPQVPPKIWHQWANDTLEKIEIFCWQNFKFWRGVKFEGRFGTLLGPQSPTQNLASVGQWYTWKKLEILQFVLCSAFAPFCVSVITGSRNTQL